jgi:NTP pyrophosphatase (non-canonical NTP hydrolase)
MADVLLYLIRLADVLNIDLAEVTTAKLRNSEERFSVESFKGLAPKKS